MKRDHLRIVMKTTGPPIQRPSVSPSTCTPDDEDNAAYWTVKSLAKLWNVSECTVRREMANGGLHYVKIGGAIRVPDKERKAYEIMQTQ